MELIGPTLDRESDCEAVLRSLPSWFGIESALQMYVRDTRRFPTFAYVSSGSLVGFLTLREHFPESWEIHCIAVRASDRNRGVGTRLLEHAEDWLGERGAHYLQVKTIAEESPDEGYAETRTFYRRRGFVPLEVFPELWAPEHPALQLVKKLNEPASTVRTKR